MLPISQQEIPRDISKELGGISNVTFPRQGHTSDVGIVHSESGIAVIKRAKGTQYAEWLRREAVVLKCLSQTSLPVPKVRRFYQHEVAEAGIQSWLLMEYLPGETLRKTLTVENDPVTRFTILSEFGRSLRELHATPCPEELMIGGAWLDYMLKQAAYNLEHFTVDGTPELLKRLQTTKPSNYRQTLIHGDCNMDNILVCEGRISGIIDWSGGAYGDPRYDVSLAVRSKPNIFQRAEDHRAFYEGYGEKIITDEEFEYFEDGLYAFF